MIFCPRYIHCLHPTGRPLFYRQLLSQHLLCCTLQAYIETSSAPPNATVRTVLQNDQFNALHRFGSCIHCVPVHLGKGMSVVLLLALVLVLVFTLVVLGSWDLVLKVPVLTG